MTLFTKALVATALFIAPLSPAYGAVPTSLPGGGAPPLVDHHVHIFSPDAAKALAAICEKLGPSGCPPEVSHQASNGQEVVDALDKAGIGKAVLLSGGYFFGSPELADQPIDIPRETRHENRFIVAEARAHCGRLVPMVSVAPLASNAVDEVRYWGSHPGAAGLKLHLGSAKFDFRDPAQVKKLAAVFRAAGQSHLAIVIHLQTRNPDFGAEDARIFLTEVFPQAKGVPIQIAHAAGGGGIDPGELAALGVFADAIAKDPKGTKNLYFDLAMVPDLFANAGKIPATPDHTAALEKLMAQIGLNRFLLGSDYTPGLDLAAYFANEKQALGLSDAQWNQLVSNIAPYVRKGPVCRA